MPTKRCLHCHLVDALNRFIADAGGDVTLSELIVGQARALATSLRNAPEATRTRALSAFNAATVEMLAEFRIETPATPPPPPARQLH